MCGFVKMQEKGKIWVEASNVRLADKLFIKDKTTLFSSKRKFKSIEI